MKTVPFFFAFTTNFFFFIFICQNTVHAQQQLEISLIKADSSWGKEVFHFPLSFAPEIKYKGYEEARFPKSWAKKDSAAFWSYVFAWKLETDALLTEKDLENNLRLYFDGLMSAVSGLSKEKIPASIVLFLQKKVEGSRSFFEGRIQIYDAFTLKAPLVLHATVEQSFCAAHHQSILLFRFSPKAPEHPIWKQLNELMILDAVFNKEKCK